MMPKQFDQQNTVFEKDDCFPLPAALTTDETGAAVIVTCWELSKEDLEDINKTGVVWLTIWGSRPQPLHIGTENPFK